MMASNLETTNQNTLPLATVTNREDNVFQIYRDEEMPSEREITFKRPAEHSPDVPRKRLSTSSNDITMTEIIENKLVRNMKPPNSLNLSLPTTSTLEVPSIKEMRISNRRQLHRSVSTRSYRKPFLDDRSPTTPTIRRRDDSPVGSFRKRMRLTPTLNLHREALNRTFSVRTPQHRHIPLRRLNSENGGSISQHHSCQLNRTYSGYFKKRPTSMCSLSRTPTLRRNGSVRIVSTKVKVKRCYSTASLQRRREKVAVGRKISNAAQKRPRRCSEPFLLETINAPDKWTRKHSVNNRAHGKRRLSTAGILPASSKQKLQALAKDELLASLNVPLSAETEISVVDDQEDEDDLIDTELEVEDSDEKKALVEKERRETKRLLIIEEILETEKNYISCLETLNAVFRSQLKDANIITEKDLNSLFPSHLQNIKESHTHFMKELEERMNNVDWRGIIGDIFAKMTSASMNLLEMYTAYVNSFPKAISTLSKCTRSSNKFRKFLEDCYENPVVERLDLPSFLLSPVQRLPRYILLLRELLKYTDEDHPDRYFISEAMSEMESLISSLNSSIHKSMEFYSASDSRRKKMSRQLTSKKRKQRASSTILRNNKNLKSVNENKSDNDQGYCSFGERKDESPEDDTNTGRKTRSSTWRGNGKRSMSMVSNASDDSNKPVMRRKQELVLGRNTDTRKSWRRSIGAVFSHLWSANREEEEIPRVSDSKEDISMETSESLDLSEFNERGSQDNLDGVHPMNSTPSRRKSSSARRKVAITHSLPSPTIEEVEMVSPTVEVLDGNENIQQINTLVKNASINDDDDVTPTASAPLSTGETELSSCITSDDERRNSTESEVSNTSSTLKTPSSPQNFRRGGRLRGSAGPVFKSIFQKSSNKMQKTLSMDALNEKFTQEEKKKRSLKKKSKDNHHHKSATAIPQSPPAGEGYGMVKSLSSYMISHEKDNHSISSTETISSKTSGSVKGDDGDYVITDNNNSTVKHKVERKSKIFKTLKSFVGKK